MLDGMMLMWFALTAASVLFVAIDSRSTPASPVLKWGFVLFTLYGGPIGAFLYVLGCREPLPGTHERYVAARWRQTLGSTIHCVAGDGVGILAGAVIGSLLLMSPRADIALEYVLGFGLGWTIFQALFMKDMAGGSYTKALRTTFLAEFLSMNVLMAAMVPVATLFHARVAESQDPGSPAFWFAMSMALIAGLMAAYPMNWWLVARHLKHGMLTVRPNAMDASAARGDAHDRRPDGGHAGGRPAEGGGRDASASAAVAGGTLIGMTMLSLAVLVLGLAVAARIAAHA